MSKTSFFFVSDFCLCLCALTKIYCLSLDSRSAYMQAVITYAKQQYLSPPHKYILLPHTNTFHGHRQIFNSCTQTALSAAKKLKFMFEAECILYKIGVPSQTNSYLNHYAMQKCKLDLSKDFAQDDKMPHFGRFCGVCSARVCFCLPYVARGARSGLVWRSPPYG